MNTKTDIRDHINTIVNLWQMENHLQKSEILLENQDNKLHKFTTRVLQWVAKGGII